MLLLLRNVNDGNVFYLTGKEKFLVGRKECDLLIQNDQSISRKHAIIYLKENKVTVEDCGSKYKTLHKGEQLTPNIEVEIAIGDSIQFGVSNSLYSLEKYEFETAGTRLSNTAKSKLMNDLSKIKGKYVEQWTSSCTHLTVEQITLTIKFLHALIDEKPVVKPSYWAKFAERVEKNLPPPNIDQHNKPPVAEVLLNKIDLKPNPNRKTLFKGKQFIFSKEKDKKQLEDIIKKAGGTSISWEKNPLPLEDIKASPKEFLIIQTTEAINDANLKNIIKEFSKQGKRTIPLQEVATSIVHCTCERDCNPNFNRIEQVFPVSRPREPTQNNALAANTESEYFTVKDYKIEENEGPLVIPGTFENNLDESEPCKIFPIDSEVVSAEEKSIGQSTKRLNSEKVDEIPAKKTKVDTKNKAFVKQEKMDSFLHKNISPKNRCNEETMTDKQNKNESETKTNPFAFLNKNKRCKTEINSTRNNPFKITKRQNTDASQVNDDNPFKLSLRSKKRENEDNTDQSICKKKKGDPNKKNIFSSTRIENISHNLSDLSKISRINKNVANITWISKNKSNITANPKEEMENYFDIEMQQFINKFKNTVVVEIMENIPTKSKILRDDVDGVKVSKGVINFKIFKKVMPIRPQSRIIGKISFTAIDPGNTTGIVENRREFHNSDDETGESLKVKKKMPKKFII